LRLRAGGSPTASAEIFGVEVVAFVVGTAGVVGAAWVVGTAWVVAVWLLAGAVGVVADGWTVCAETGADV
jgi:hypothetical protein